VTSLGNLATKDGLIAFAGINSSASDQKAGKNEHFRSFSVQYPRKRTAQGKEKDSSRDADGAIAFLGKTSLFKHAGGENKETYQRRLRLSPAKRRESGNKRIGAVATGLAKQSEIVFFDATSATPQSSDIIQRISPPKGAEAADIDIIERAEGEFLIAYCTDYEVYVNEVECYFDKKKSKIMPKSELLHSLPLPDVFEISSRPKLRALRFLTPRHLLLLCNLPNKSGAELSILRVYKTGPGSLIFRKKLPKHIKAAVSLDVCLLDEDPELGFRQIVVAVAGQDISIEVLVIDYLGYKEDRLSKFRSYKSLQDVHPLQMTGLVFEPFNSPEKQKHLRLASYSMGNTVVVDSFPLLTVTASQSRKRHILSAAGEQIFRTGSILLLLSLMAVVTAFLLQSYLVAQAENPQSARFLDSLPTGVQNFVDKYIPQLQQQRANVLSGTREKVVSVAENVVPDSVQGAGAQLRELLSSRAESEEDAAKAIIIRSSPEGEELSTEVHPDLEAYVRDATAEGTTLDKEDGGAVGDKHPVKKWEELSAQAKDYWRTKLEQAGAWAASEGETVLKGVFFSEWAGFVGGVVGDALRG
jgi:prolactin regulatory element-binding protein